jgi:hypothetical protein
MGLGNSAPNILEETEKNDESTRQNTP